VHNLPEALPPKPKSKDPKRKEATALAAEPDHKQRCGDHSGSFTKKMVSPSVVGVAVATARAGPEAIAATTTGTRVAAVMVYLAQIPSRYRCLHRRMIIGKRTRGAVKSREALLLASYVEPRLLCLTATSSSCRERLQRRSPAPTIA
jgi:hypothetical protein